MFAQDNQHTPLGHAARNAMKVDVVQDQLADCKHRQTGSFQGIPMFGQKYDRNRSKDFILVKIYFSINLFINLFAHHLDQLA